jgi:hypothetical protein
VVRATVVAALLLVAPLAWSEDSAGAAAPAPEVDADGAPVFPALQSRDPIALKSELSTSDHRRAEALLVAMRAHPEPWMKPAALLGIHGPDLDVATDCLDFLAKGAPGRV